LKRDDTKEEFCDDERRKNSAINILDTFFYFWNALSL